MDTIIGLGNAGCQIADKFAEYQQYTVFKIDSENLEPDEHSFVLPRYKTPEDYEKKTPSLRKFLKPATKDILFIVCGAGAISGAALKILQCLKSRNINILYIKPDLKFLGEKNLLQEHLVRNVLQEYARSGVFNQLYIVDNNEVEKILGEVPIMSFYDKINDLIVSTVHMVNVYQHLNSVYSTPQINKEINKISTFGLVDLESEEEKLFFSLDNLSEKCYYYAINQETLETDGSLLRRLTESIAKNTEDEKVNTSFQVYSTSYNENYGYILAKTSETNN
tara:strand:+ start:2551 stop:3387 length:837 start_codon:yes stop_codon:yes gene_type:complete